MDAKEAVTRIFDEMINKGNLDIIDEMFTEDYIDHGVTGDLHGSEA